MKILEWVHPEIKENEIFLINIKKGERFFKRLPSAIKSIRVGKIAYTSGNIHSIVLGMKPLFATLNQSL